MRWPSPRLAWAPFQSSSPASEEQKEQYLPDIAAGKKLAAFGLTEANAGSNVAGMQTRAVKDGDYYIINGTKQWITNGGEAEVYTVFAVTNPGKGPRGISAFIIDKGTEGFSFGNKEDKLGIRGSATRELVFQDCRVHKSQLLGREGTGFITAMKTFDLSRPGVASQAVGIASGALDLAIEFANNRKQFGVPVSSFQGLRFMLADMAMRVESSRALVYATARHIDAHPGERCTLYSAMSKCFASDMAMSVTTDAIQVFGGHGYMREYPHREVHARRQNHPDLRRHQPNPARRDWPRPHPGTPQPREGEGVTARYYV